MIGGCDPHLYSNACQYVESMNSVGRYAPTPRLGIHGRISRAVQCLPSKQSLPLLPPGRKKILSKVEIFFQ